MSETKQVIFEHRKNGFVNCDNAYVGSNCKINSMTSEQFNTYWALNFADSIPIPHYFRQDYSDRWFRIHSLPGSKRYADNEEEWNILLDRQNKIITDLFRKRFKFHICSNWRLFF